MAKQDQSEVLMMGGPKLIKKHRKLDRAQWGSLEMLIMEDALRAKFHQNRELRKILVESKTTT